MYGYVSLMPDKVLHVSPFLVDGILSKATGSHTRNDNDINPKALAICIDLFKAFHSFGWERQRSQTLI